MGLISEYVEIKLGGRNIKYYENLGYKIPRHMDKNKDMVVANGTTILVKISDLMPSSSCVVKIQCDNCNDILNVKWNDYNNHNHNGKYYCNKCANKIFLSGENHPRWNPNLSQEEREQGRNYPEYIEFIKKVLKRDNYTCQCCGDNNTKRNIEVHHLDGYDWCKQKRTDETNGITLCHNCHKNFHSIYGYGNNTKEQFEEWIGHAIEELEKYEGELPTTRKIYCIEENKIYDSAYELANELNCGIEKIYAICGKYKTTHKGIHELKNGIKKEYISVQYHKSIKGKHLLYYDEYIKMTKEDIQKYLEWCKHKTNSDKISGLNHYASKIIYVYSSNFELLLKDNLINIGKWLVENNFLGTVESGRRIPTKYLDKEKPYYSKLKPYYGLFFRKEEINNNNKIN